jgi:hypothetical protein
LTRPIRSAASADHSPRDDELLRAREADDLGQPRRAAEVRDQPDPVSGMPISASTAITGKPHASASSTAPPMHAPCTSQTTGLAMSSARL